MPTGISRAGLAKAEDVLIKLGCLLQIVNLDRDVNDARHVFFLLQNSTNVLMWVTETGHGIPCPFIFSIGSSARQSSVSRTPIANWWAAASTATRSHRRPDEKVQSSQANSGSMLSGARRVHPVIVGWSIANRPLIPSPSNDDPAAAWPRATPSEKLDRSGVVARHCMVVRD